MGGIGALMGRSACRPWHVRAHDDERAGKVDRDQEIERNGMVKVGPVGAKYPISDRLWGVFFEDLNYAADGGLAGDLVQNGAFEYSHRDNPRWSAFTAWRKDVPKGSHGSFWIETEDCVAEENPHHAVVQVELGPVSLVNRGFEGMRLRPGEQYELSMWIRSCDGAPHPVDISLLGDPRDDDAAPSGPGARCEALPGEWRRIELRLTVDSDASNGSLALTFTKPGVVAVDFVSLEPCRTWRGLTHFRADLAEAIAELRPRFVRFPGGCLVHGLGLDNMYRWKDTIGPVEHRRHDFNLWGYHQSMRLGFYEYLCWCEALGAEPIPVLPAGVSCSGTDGGSMAMSPRQMGEYVRDVLDFVDFCNGDASTVWGAKRIACGHPEPFGLAYLGLGNEDDITDDFRERFSQLFHALAYAHPEITVIGTAGPTLVGATFDEAWDLARAEGVALLDEHSYLAPAWWFQHLDYYDGLDRNGPHAYLGEYASHGVTMLNALSEAAFMAHMEANGDVVDMASYAPLLCRNGHSGWDPDLIYFDDDRAYRTYSYWVQWMYAHSAAESARRVEVEGPCGYTRELPEYTGLSFGGDPAVRLSGIAVELPDGSACTVPDLFKESGSRADTGLHVTADRYTIRLHARYESESGMFSIDFGALDQPDRYRLWIGMAGLDCALGALRDGFPYDYDRVSLDRRVSYGDEWDISIEVHDRGRSIRASVNGTVLAGSDPGEETRRTVTVAEGNGVGGFGMRYVRVVNATPETMHADLSKVLPPHGRAWTNGYDDPHAPMGTALVTMLRAERPDAGRPGEEAPSRPVEREIVLPADGLLRFPAWSFTILGVPMDMYGPEGGEHRQSAPAGDDAEWDRIKRIAGDDPGITFDDV